MPDRRTLRLVPIILLIHNLEEVVFMRGVLPLDAARIPEALRGWLPRVTYPQFLVALAVVTVIPFVIAAAGDLRRRGGTAVGMLLAVQAVLLLNVLSHLGAAIGLGGYAPGLATALLINLPFSIHLFRRANRERWISRRAMLGLPLIAILIHGPGLVGLMMLAGRVT